MSRGPGILSLEANNIRGALLVLLRRYGVKVLLGSLRTPQAQALAEKANSVVEDKLAKWKADYGSPLWHLGLAEIAVQMKSQDGDSRFDFVCRSSAESVLQGSDQPPFKCSEAPKDQRINWLCLNLRTRQPGPLCALRTQLTSDLKKKKGGQLDIRFQWRYIAESLPDTICESEQPQLIKCNQRVCYTFASTT